MNRVCLLAGLLPLLGIGLRAADWPQFLGPDRNNVSRQEKNLKPWPKDGPRKLWDHKVGSGWSAPVAAAGKVLIFHRRNGDEIVDCLDAASGNPVWQFISPTDYVDGFNFDNGPRATPAIANGRVYLFGADGNLHCVRFADGKKVWSVNLQKTLGTPSGFFGLACSPLVHAGSVLLNVGAPNGAGIVAIDAASGKLLWKTLNDKASYSSPVLQTFAGTQRAVFITRNHLISLSPSSGKIDWKLMFSPAMQSSVSGSAPIIAGDVIFTTASYGAGAKTVIITTEGPRILWKNDDSLSSHYHTPLLVDGHLYGFHGRLDTGPPAEFRCVELKTGQVKWKNSRVDAGAIIGIGNEILILTVNGQLLRGSVSPSGYTEMGRKQVLGFNVRAHPALAENRFYARDESKLVCILLQ